MSKDLNRELRRVGRPARDRRVRSGYLRQLAEEGDRLVRKSPPSRKPREKLNWRVLCHHGEVVAVEPDREFEHVFEGGADPFWQAVEYAAKQLREERQA